ncbi:hypothetical protein BpHYR1_016147 [Brachionus plicatilis]|uniref:Uncharacterized protein n=1 Tax=Brachionus plicatilis TaxID=10195 RepID=A0A3M7RP84_BRAPC|nr:hypothetical protein BpHYR1_016147 [Brachionus plicatilis]
MKHQSNIEKASGSITNYLGAVCNIQIEDCKDFEIFKEFEINSVVSVFLFTREKPGIVIIESDEFRPEYANISCCGTIECDCL